MSAAQAFTIGCICGAAFVLALQLWQRRRATPRLDALDSIEFASQCERVIARSGSYTPEQLRALRADWREGHYRPAR